MMNDRAKPQANRTMLGVLLAILAVAVLLALWFLIFDRGDSSASGSNGSNALPTPVTIPTSVQVAVTPTPIPTTETLPAVTPTPVPEGFEACSEANSPLTTTTYVVDTNTTPLNQRAEPSVASTQSGTFAPGQDDLVFTGECVVNLNDQFTWWKIFNGTADVWVASDFVTPN